MTGAVATSFATLEDAWARTADRWLPYQLEKSIWRFSRNRDAALPAQGWKIHVSATILNAQEVLEAVAPVLNRRCVLFKAPRTLVELKRLNCGLFYGYMQVGKFITAYPQDDQQSGDLARELDTATRGMNAPAVPFEVPVSAGSNVFIRFGSFGAGPGEVGDDEVVSPDGQVLSDRRDLNPSWAQPPTGALGLNREPHPRSTPLSSTYRAYSSLMQRGKGGVYRALDLSTTPPRLCVLKEGRSSGEVDWDGSCGLTWVRHEANVLAQLAGSPVLAPAVYDYFEQDGNGYLVLEWIEGTRVADLVAPAAPLLDLPSALVLGRDCASLTARVHEHGWVWRDLKPQNLVLSAGVLRPLDFEGAAQAGEIVSSPWGTVGYVPPEWINSATATCRQDCFALGIVLHQVLTNSVAKPSNDQLPPVTAARPDAPPALDRIIAALTDPAPSQRPSAVDVEKELAALAG